MNPFNIGDTVTLINNETWAPLFHGEHLIKDINGDLLRFGHGPSQNHHSHFRLVKPGVISKMAAFKNITHEITQKHLVKDWNPPVIPNATEPVQSDPDGLQAHEKGAKLDAGKPEASLLLDFGLALLEVAKVGTVGAKKYSRHGWLHVDEGERRYRDAMIRHLLVQATEERDAETNLLHAAQVAWNALAALELQLRRTANHPS